MGHWDRVVEITTDDQATTSSGNSNTNSRRQYPQNPVQFYSEELCGSNKWHNNQQVLYRGEETWSDIHSDNAELQHRGILPTPSVHSEQNISRTIVQTNQVNYSSIDNKFVIKKIHNVKNRLGPPKVMKKVIDSLQETLPKSVSEKIHSCPTDLDGPEIKKRRAERFSKEPSVPVVGKIVSLTVKNRNDCPSKQVSVAASVNKPPEKKVIFLNKRPVTSSSKPAGNIEDPAPPPTNKSKADISIRTTTTYNQVRSKMNKSKTALYTPAAAPSVPASKPTTSTTIVPIAKSRNDIPETKLKVKRLQKLHPVPRDIKKVDSSVRNEATLVKPVNTPKPKIVSLKPASASKVVTQTPILAAAQKHNKPARPTLSQNVVSLKRSTNPEDPANKKRRLEKFSAPETDVTKPSFLSEDYISLDLSQNKKPFKKTRIVAPSEELVTIKYEEDEILWDDPVIELGVEPELRCLNVSKDHADSNITSSSATQHDTGMEEGGNVEQLKKSIIQKINLERGNKRSNNANKFENLIDRIVDKILDDPEIKQSLQQKHTDKASTSTALNPLLPNEFPRSAAHTYTVPKVIKKKSYPNSKQDCESPREKVKLLKQKKHTRKMLIVEQSSAETDKLMTTYCDENRGRQYAVVQQNTRQRNAKQHPIQTLQDSGGQPHPGHFLAEFAEKSTLLSNVQPQHQHINSMNRPTLSNFSEKRQTSIASNQAYKYKSTVGVMDSQPPPDQYYTTKSTEKRHTLLPSPAQYPKIQHYRDETVNYTLEAVQKTTRSRSPVLDNHPAHDSNSQLPLQQFPTQPPKYYTDQPSTHQGSIPRTVRSRPPIFDNRPAQNSNSHLHLQQFPTQPPEYYTNQPSTRQGSYPQTVRSMSPILDNHPAHKSNARLPVQQLPTQPPKFYTNQPSTHERSSPKTVRSRSPVLDNHPAHNSNSHLLLQQFPTPTQPPKYYANYPSTHQASSPKTVRTKSPVLDNRPAQNSNSHLLLQQFPTPTHPPKYYTNHPSTREESILNTVFTGYTQPEQKSHHKIHSQNPSSSRFDTHQGHQQYSTQVNTRNTTHSDQVKPTRQAQPSKKSVNLHCRSCHMTFTSESLLQDHLQSDLHLMVSGEWWKTHPPPPATVTLRDVVWCILCQKDFRFTSTKLLREHLVCERHCAAKSSWVHQLGKPPMYDWCLFNTLTTD